MRRHNQSKTSPTSGEIVLMTPTEPTSDKKEEDVEGLLLEEIE